MTTILRCESTDCQHNEEGKCTKEEITLDDCTACDQFEEED